MLGNTDEPGIMVLATRVIFDEIKRRCNRSFIVRLVAFIVLFLKMLPTCRFFA